MHGLNTYHTVDYTPPINYTYEAGSPYDAEVQVWSVDVPTQITAALPDLVSNPDKQFWVKRNYGKLTYSNAGQHKFFMEVTRLRCRLDVAQPANIFTISSDDVDGTTPTFQAINTPYMSFMIGDTMRRTFKLLSQKRRILGPTQTKTIKIPSNRYKYRKPISSDIEGNTEFTYRKGDLLTVVRFYGTPCNWTNSITPGTNISGLTAFFVRGIYTRYMSYYAMDDATPTSTIGQSAGFTSISLNSNSSYLPTMYGLTNDTGKDNHITADRAYVISGPG